MADIRIHRSRPEGGFAQIPNATCRDGSLSYAARGYLAEMLTNIDGWHPESHGRAVARAREERGDDAEPARQVQRMLAELERRGYRHRVRRRPGNLSAFVNEIHFYDVPTRPCEDALTCESCHRARVSPGHAESSDLQTPADLGEQGVSAGRPECAVSEGSESADPYRRPSVTEHHQKTRDLNPHRRGEISDSNHLEPGPARLCWCGGPVDESDPWQAEAGLCLVHAMLARPEEPW